MKEKNIEFKENKIEKELSETSYYPILNSQLQQRYDRISAQWNSEVYSGIRRDDLIQKIVDSAEIDDNQSLLEVMCGSAVLSSKIKEQYANARSYILDFSIGMLNVASDNLLKIQASVIGMPFSDDVFDRIFLRNGLFDLPKRLQIAALKEIKRIIKKEGIFILQTHYTTSETREVLNNIVNAKDRIAGQYQDMGKETPRYFALMEEIEGWLLKVGFKFKRIHQFESEIKYQKTQEMPEVGKKQWAEYVNGLSKENKDLIRLREDEDGNLVFSFPGIIYKIFN